MNRTHVRMMQCGGRLCLAEEALLRFLREAKAAVAALLSS